MDLNCSVVNNSEAALILFQQVGYTPVFAVGLPLNISALWFFFRIRHWTSTHIYMFNLMLADFLLILFLPFRIFDTFCPMRPSEFCTFLICVHYSNMYVSIFTIAVISAHRFIAIKFPLLTKALEARKKAIAKIVCVLIWMMVMSICTSFLDNLRKDKLRKCYVHRADRQLQLSFLLVLEIVGYLLPIAIITICSTQAICTILKSTEADGSLQQFEKKDVLERKRIVAIITANMIVFIVCFTPIHISYLVSYLSPHEPGKVKFSSVFYEVSEWIATTNCCLDSVGYYLLLKKVFRAKS
ncbi:G-protein coupled receptor 55 [Colossoma macropomum]|uniref:G-protein coupled receptor 55 n=1 Tax=Colossoma macropomum TaxID=42526 RepID=UPI0018651935|nr:G-protein coupled receptor 55 [Colossoma macropomum]